MKTTKTMTSTLLEIIRRKSPQSQLSDQKFGSSAESVGEKSDKPAQCLKRRQRLGLAHMGDPEVLVVSESHIFQALYSSRRSIRFHRVGFRDR